MNLSFSTFFQQFLNTPALRLITLLVVGVILVNGWTDAPNAIASCVSTGAIDIKKAIQMAAIFNFAGLLAVSVINTKVAFAIYRIADFGDSKEKALIALCASMIAIILWAFAAWIFGIPTSESHALIAAITGAAIALRGGMAGIRLEEWGKILWGLLLSVLTGYIFGMLGAMMIKKRKRNLGDVFFTRAQILGGAAMSFMHGAQDGQKFMGIFMLSISLFNGWEAQKDFTVPLWMMILCAVLIAAGTAVGGKRIISKVGSEMVTLQKYQGFSSDIAAAITLLYFSLMGLPVSTTHVKTTAMMGAGSVGEEHSLNKGVMAQMFIAWILTFPCCGVIGYLLAQGLMSLF